MTRPTTTQPTPYDTGDHLEPQVWPIDGDPDRYGRVDLDDDEGATILTLRARRAAGVTVLEVEDHAGDLNVVVDGRLYAPVPIAARAQTTAPSIHLAPAHSPEHGPTL